MGNVCVSREDAPEEDFKIHEKYRKLQDEVCATLADRDRFTEECGQSYRAACQSRGVQLLNKPLMTEMTRHFLQRLACDDDPRMVGKIYLSLERQFPHEDEPIMEASFKDFIQDVLIQIDRDISEKLRKLEAKYPGQLKDGGVEYNEYEQLAIDDSLQQEFAGGGVGKRSAAAMQDDMMLNTQTQETNARIAKLRQQQQQSTLAELQQQSFSEEYQKQKQQQSALPQQQQQQMQLDPLRPSMLNSTYDANGEQQRQLAPPRTLPGPADLARQMPNTFQAQPPLSAAALQKHQNSLALQAQRLQPVAVQEAPMTNLGGSMPPYAAGPPPTNSNPMLTQPSIFNTSLTSIGQPLPLSNYQDANALRPPPTNLQTSIGGQAPTTAPLVTGPPVQPTTLSEFTKEDVDRMKHQITSATDGLKVQVYNQHLQLEPKRLSLNRQLGKIGIFDVVEGGLGYPTAFFDIPDLKCITQGISQSIMEVPPRADVALGFRFSQESPDTKDRSQDKFLCFVFESPEMCRLAGEAFSQLCGVPVAPAV